MARRYELQSPSRAALVANPNLVAPTALSQLLPQARRCTEPATTAALASPAMRGSFIVWRKDGNQPRCPGSGSSGRKENAVAYPLAIKHNKGSHLGDEVVGRTSR